MLKMTKLWAVLLVGMMVFVGCKGKSKKRSSSDDDERTPTKKAETPKEAAIAFTKAIAKGDKEQYMAMIATKDEELAGAVFDAVSASRSFADAFVAKYGDAHSDVISNLRMAKEIPTPEEVKDKGEVTEEGDKAKVKVPGKGEDGLDLIKKDGVWLVDLDKDMPKGEEKETVLKQCKAMATVTPKVKALIGKEGYDADKIMAELDKRLKEYTGQE